MLAELKEPRQPTAPRVSLCNTPPLLPLRVDKAPAFGQGRLHSGSPGPPSAQLTSLLTLWQALGFSVCPTKSHEIAVGSGKREPSEGPEKQKFPSLL